MNRRSTAKHPVFVTRRFPPSIGGMETLAASVWSAVSQARPDAVLIAHSGSNRRLPGWLVRSVARMSWLMARRSVEVVLVGDAATYAVISRIARLFRVPAVAMVMGLDVTFPHPLYRAVVRPALRRSSQVVAISAAARDCAIEVGVPRDRIEVVRLGVDRPAAPSAGIDYRDWVHRLLAVPDEVTVLLTLGRLVERKGVRWLVANVVPILDPRIHYAVAGTGPDLERIREAVSRHGLEDRVHLLGEVDDETRERLMRGADMFVQPNIPVAGDLEGFGLVVVEAAMRSTLVLAADLEGIRDAVVDGETGRLVPPGDAPAWADTIRRWAEDDAGRNRDSARFAAAASDLYGTEAMAAAIRRILGIGRTTT